MNLKNLFLFTLILLSASCTRPELSTPSPTQGAKKILENTPTSKPQKHLIKTAFVPQAPEKNWDQPWQDACEEAALLTLHYYYQNITPNQEQIKNDLSEIFSYQTSQGWGHDTNLSEISHVLTDFYRYQTKIIDKPTINEIENLLWQNTPILVTANGKTLFEENKYFRSGGPNYHALVILGYDQNKEVFTVHDVGTQHGAYFNIHTRLY